MIRLRTITTAALSALIATVAFAGCGGDGGSGLGDNSGGTGDPNNGGSGNGGDVKNGNGDGGTSGGSGGDGGVGNIVNCAGTTAQAALKPVNLIFMFDKSGSMVTDSSGNNIKATKWTPIVQASEAFFSDGQSAGMSAELTFFSGSSCNTTSFDDPSVALTKLPDPTSFTAAFDATNPNGGTPTYAALGGAVTEAKGVASSHPKDATVIVLATDGTPEDSCDTCADQCGCSGSSCDVQNTCTRQCKINRVATQATAALNGTPSIKTYVIGIATDTTHDSLKNLDTVASAGGTGSATLVDVKDPAATKQSLINALNAIRQQEFSCNLPIPAAPDGKQINYDAVRVNFTSGSGVPTTLPYSEACTGSDGKTANTGWHYDNKAAPKNIVLCTSTCGTVQKDPSGKVNVAFDCQGPTGGGGTGPIH